MKEVKTMRKRARMFQFANLVDLPIEDEEIQRLEEFFHDDLSIEAIMQMAVLVRIKKLDEIITDTFDRLQK